MIKIRSGKFSLKDIKASLLVFVVTKGALAALSSKNRKSKTGALLNLAALPAELKASLHKTLRNRNFSAKPLETATLTLLEASPAETILFVGWDDSKLPQFESVARYRKLGAVISDAAERLNAQTVAIADDSLEIASEENASAFIEGFVLNGYRFDQYKSNKEDKPKAVAEIQICSSPKIAEKVISETLEICKATIFARDLVNMPPLDCTPSFLVRKAKELAKRSKLAIQVLDRERLKKMGANSLLSVAKGSSEPPYLIKLTYKPKGRAARVLSLVGKGVTFDSGGLSIKTASGMESMKCDMSGAAAVLASMQAISVLKPRMEVRAYIPTTENMINGQATRPGDVVRAMSGKSIEILNTDAEGRLILADALCLAEKEKCDSIIDLATLTGACMVALGSEYAGLFCENDKMVERLISAGELSGERLWRMPLAPEYKDLIKSPTADIKNTGGPYGGAITAALFLKEFVKTDKWAHLDIAGPAFADGPKGFIKKGGVGFGVRTICRYVLGK